MQIQSIYLSIPTIVPTVNRECMVWNVTWNDFANLPEILKENVPTILHKIRNYKSSKRITIISIYS